MSVNLTSGAFSSQSFGSNTATNKENWVRLSKSKMKYITTLVLHLKCMYVCDVRTQVEDEDTLHMNELMTAKGCINIVHNVCM